MSMIQIIFDKGSFCRIHRFLLLDKEDRDSCNTATLELSTAKFVMFFNYCYLLIKLMYCTV